MKCPFCNSLSNKVVDKRAVNATGEIRRRRECLRCSQRFTTYERMGDWELVVIKKDGRREQFIKEKLRNGLLRALEKRPALDKVEVLADRIESKLRLRYPKEVQSSIIGKTVLLELKRLDKIAYLRFASVYRSFEDPTDFAKELSSLT